MTTDNLRPQEVYQVPLFNALDNELTISAAKNGHSWINIMTVAPGCWYDQCRSDYYEYRYIFACIYFRIYVAFLKSIDSIFLNDLFSSCRGYLINPKYTNTCKST